MSTLAEFCAAHAPVSNGGSFSAGSIFGDWRVTAFIGRGGNGEVYCAEHVAIGAPAAVKVLMRDEERAKERFVREAKLLAKLKSRSFPRFFAYGEANGRAYLAMELLEPGELPTGDRAVAKFMLKVCEAVWELHDLGYVHRDIKPGNILWRIGRAVSTKPPLATPVLADLGLVKEIKPANAKLPDSQFTIGGIGTPGYGAPEQMERGEATAASDIHALGVLADRCFDGKPPRAWKRIIECATSSIPARRYASVTALAWAIRRRHWGMYALAGFCMALCVALAFVAMPTNTTFPGVMRLNGKTAVLKEPVVLESGKEYQVFGPGTLDADLFCPTTAIVRLKNCVLINRTKRLYPENGIKYRLDDGVYLNFINVKKAPLGLRVRDFTGTFDGAYNQVRFGGPETVKELIEQISEERSRELQEMAP